MESDQGSDQGLAEGRGAQPRDTIHAETPTPHTNGRKGSLTNRGIATCHELLYRVATFGARDTALTLMTRATDTTCRDLACCFVTTTC